MSEKGERDIMHQSTTISSTTEPLLLPEHEPVRTPLPKPGQHCLQQGWTIVKHYPLPAATLVLLVISLLVWLIGYRTLANWILLAIVLTGVLPLLWNTLQQFLHKEFSIDVIALLAIGGSLFLSEYLAGALIVLMLSGGEALEAYALRRARLSLSALAQRAPRTAHIW